MHHYDDLSKQAVVTDLEFIMVSFYNIIILYYKYSSEICIVVKQWTLSLKLNMSNRFTS